MEATSLCIRLMRTVLLLLVAQVHFSYSHNDLDFPQVVPDTQQLFAHESLVVSCEGLEGLTGWRVMREIRGVIKTCGPTWSTSTGPCRISTAYPEMDSGKYWCEMRGTKKSNAVNITVTAGAVILESPVLPVTEGDAVTLSCRQKQTSSNLTADFYKDGYFMESSSTGSFTINTVSKSNEGLYKCNIGAEESAESRLIVRATDEEPHHTYNLSLLLSIVAFDIALLLLVGLLHFRKHKEITTVATYTVTKTHEEESLLRAETDD